MKTPANATGASSVTAASNSGEGQVFEKVIFCNYDNKFNLSIEEPLGDVNFKVLFLSLSFYMN